MNIRSLAKTAIPLALILFLQVAIGALDTLFLKRQGDLNLLASFSLGNGSYNSIGVVFAGIFAVAGVYYSQFRENNKRMQMTFIVFGFLLAIGLGLVLQLWAFVWEGPEIRAYLRWRTLGVFPYLLAIGFRYIYAGDEKTIKMIPVFVVGLSFKFLCNTLFYPVTSLKKE